MNLMNPIWNRTLLNQLLAAIDMLRNAIEACPDEIWFDRDRKPEFWYVAYHCLFFLDYYLTESPDMFVPPEPFNMDELDPAGILPEEPFAKDVLLGFLEHGRRKAAGVIEEMTDDWAAQSSPFREGRFTNAELLFTSLRHVQHHAAQLNLLLRQETDSAPRWVGKAKVE